MAKKKTNNTTKATKPVVEETQSDTMMIGEYEPNTNNVSYIEESVGCCSGTYREPYDRKLEIVNIEKLVAYEKAASIVCGRYEVKARLSGEDNAKFMEFLEYHKLIVGELEKRVVEVCKKVKDS